MFKGETNAIEQAASEKKLSPTPVVVRLTGVTADTGARLLFASRV